MANTFANGNYPKPTFAKPFAILGPDGQPLPPSNGRGRTATDRFADQYGINRGPESAFAVPQVLTFTSILGSAYRNYYHGQYDEAMRFSREDALAMRNDAYVRALVDERKLAVASLKWHLEVDNPKDPWEKSVRDGMTLLLRRIPRWSDLTWSGLEALWFGRSADQLVPRFKSIKLPALPKTQSGGGLPTISMAPAAGERETREALCIVNHLPIEGDKIDYDYDGNPYILVTPMAANHLIDAGADVRRLADNGRWVTAERLTDTDLWPHIRARHAEFGYTTIGGRALYLKGTWRDRFRIHTHEALDTSFFQPWKASAVHGVGIRSVIFWYWWLRQEFLANVTDWCARTGLGIRIWYYEAGNTNSELAVDQAARDQTDRVNIKVPYNPGDPHRPALEFQETSGTGADLLLRIVKHVEDYLERYIVGQSMSGGGEDLAGFGDKGRSQLAASTKYQITKRDAAKFSDTNTTDLIDLIKRWTYPEAADMPVRQVYDVDDPEVEKWVKGAKDFVDMGGEIVADEARSRLGLSSPGPDDETVGGMEQLQAQQATSGHIKPPSGLNPEGSNGVPQEKPPAAQEQPAQSGGPQRFGHDVSGEPRVPSGVPEGGEWTTGHLLPHLGQHTSVKNLVKATGQPAEKISDLLTQLHNQGQLEFGQHRGTPTYKAKQQASADLGSRIADVFKALESRQSAAHGGIVQIGDIYDELARSGAAPDPEQFKQALWNIKRDKSLRLVGAGNMGAVQDRHKNLLPRSEDGSEIFSALERYQPVSYSAQRFDEGHVLPTAHGHIIKPGSSEKATGFVGVGSHGGEHKPAEHHEPTKLLPSPDELAKTLPKPQATPTTDAHAQLLSHMPKIQAAAKTWEPSFRAAGKGMDADDLAIEGYMAVQAALPNYNSSQPFPQWANTVVANRFRDMLKKKSGGLHGFGEDFDPGKIPERPSSVPVNLQDAIAKLPEIERRVMEGKLAGKTDEAIAAEEGNTNRLAIQRIGQRARSLLEKMPELQRNADGLTLLRYLCPDLPNRYVDGRSGDYRRHQGRSIEHAIERLQALADHADEATDDEIEGAVAGIAKQFTVEELREVCRELGAKGLSTKGKMIERLIDKIISSREEKSEPKEDHEEQAKKLRGLKIARDEHGMATEVRYEYE